MTLLTPSTTNWKVNFPTAHVTEIFEFNYSLFIAGAQNSILTLDIRVTELEENGGDDGNSSVAELEVRVETLEGTAADHETRITAVDSDVSGR